MKHSVRLRHLALLALAIAPAAAGCADEGTGPDALLGSGATRAALRLSAALPRLPELADRALGPGRTLTAAEAAALAEARTLWLEAETRADPGPAETLRAGAYRRAAPVLAESLAPAELAAVQDTLELWRRAALAVVGPGAFPRVDAALAEAGALLAQARVAAAAGNRTGAVEATLRAADRLAETTPGAVALRLIHEAERRLEAEPVEADGEPAPAVRRARRLLRGAREALAEGDHPRAIRRAYYAGQLLRGD